MKKHTIGVGIIGMGWMGMTHARAYRQITDRFHDNPLQPKLVICADDVVERTNEAKTRFGFERTTTDYRHVIESEDVQVVNIAAPNNMHLEIVEAATAAGKHVFCEKPVGRNPTETKRSMPPHSEQVSSQGSAITTDGHLSSNTPTN